MTKIIDDEGGCLCGAIRYRVSGAALSKTLCHCRSCRLACGGPTLAWAIFQRAHVEFIRGALSEFRSSPPARRGFCNTCGTALTYRTEKRPDHIDITTATFDHPERFAPECEIYVAEKLAWETLNPELAHHQDSSRRDPDLP
jgi:hypothetical protein